MDPIQVIDRLTGKKFEEKVFGGDALRWLYRPKRFAWLSRITLRFIARTQWFGRVYGWWQHRPWTKSKVPAFIKHFHVDVSEFAQPVESFQSFNDFFIRKLKPSARPIAEGEDLCILPADARYLFYQNISESDDFVVKGARLDLPKLLGSQELAKRYIGGTLVLARLCPTDYHRYHFPCDGTPSTPQLINGLLYSVNPIALCRQVSILWENKRVLTQIQTQKFGTILFLEIGATNVGSICHTFVPNQPTTKGQEKGFFSFGGSSIILLFEPNRIRLDEDLMRLSHEHQEVYAQMGQSLGVIVESCR